MRAVAPGAVVLALLAAVTAAASAAGAGAGAARGGAGGASGGGSAGSAGSASACRPVGSRSLASDPVARVYSLPARPGRAPTLGAGGPVYACLVRTGRRVALGGTAPFTRVGPVALAGPVVAYAGSAMGVDTSSSAVDVLDLGSGARRSLAAASTPRRPESFTGVTGLVVDRRGAVAWIASRGGVGQPREQFEVRSSSAGAAGSRLLDASPAVAPASLRLRAGRLSWTDGGRVLSARI